MMAGRQQRDKVSWMSGGTTVPLARPCIRSARRVFYLARTTDCITMSDLYAELVCNMLLWQSSKKTNAPNNAPIFSLLFAFMDRTVSSEQISFLANVNVLRYVCYMLSAVRLSSVCLSVVCDVGAPYSGGWTFRQFYSPYDSAGTLLFWCQKSLVGDAPFPLKFAFKVTHPL